MTKTHNCEQNFLVGYHRVNLHENNDWLNKMNLYAEKLHEYKIHDKNTGTTMTYEKNLI